MSDGWQKHYGKLIEYITENPEIKITSSSVEIPGEKRIEFYRLFNQVRKTFLDEKFTTFVNKSQALSASYLKIEEQVINLLGLDGISASPSLYLFLHQPVERLIKGNFDTLFNLLKGKIDIQEFEQCSIEKVKSCSYELYINGYSKWLELYLIKMLEAEKIFRVFTSQIREEIDYKTAKMIERAPLPQETKLISFDHDEEVSFTTPDFIIYSGKMNKYISARSNFRHLMVRADNKSQNREWCPIDPMFFLDPRYILVYEADNAKELSLVADNVTICRPDLVIVCVDPKELISIKRFNEDALINNKIKPVLGTFVVSIGNISPQTLENRIEDINMLEVGLSAAKLRPVVEVLKDGGKKSNYVGQMESSPKKLG